MKAMEVDILGRRSTEGSVLALLTSEAPVPRGPTLS